MLFHSKPWSPLKLATHVFTLFGVASPILHACMRLLTPRHTRAALPCIDSDMHAYIQVYGIPQRVASAVAHWMLDGLGDVQPPAVVHHDYEYGTSGSEIWTRTVHLSLGERIVTHIKPERLI